jgi:hypothetical protein
MFAMTARFTPSPIAAPMALLPNVSRDAAHAGGGAHGLRGAPSEALKPLTREFDNGVLEKAAQPKPQRTSRQAQLMKTFNTTARDATESPKPSPASQPQQVAPCQAYDNTREIGLVVVVMGTLAVLRCLDAATADHRLAA